MNGLIAFWYKGWRLQMYTPAIQCGVYLGSWHLYLSFDTVLRVTKRGCGFRILGFGLGAEYQG